ncbi:MAG: 16S rRNA (guanine(966)-N(2))-methyltransferase RsmD [Betaproteobacteria bacterium]
MRIIGGRWRRRLLHFPPAADLRPTPDRVRETLFNWLGQNLTGLSVLDLFAGSGSLAFEALSRGAVLAVAVETVEPAVSALRENAALLGATALEPRRADAVRFLQTDARGFDVIFLDPPFREQWMDRLWPLLPARLNAGGWLYVEQGQPVAPPPEWEVFRQQRAGQVHYHLLRRVTGEPTPAGA